MDSYNAIVAVYERIMALIESGHYHFRMKDSNIDYESITYDEFINMLPNIEYIDNEDPNMSRVYLNPFTRNVLLVCARKQYADGKLMLIRVPMALINTVYSLMESGIKTEYQNTLSFILRKLGELEEINENSEGCHDILQAEEEERNRNEEHSKS